MDEQHENTADAMEESNTSVPGPGGERLEKDFLESLEGEGFEINGQKPKTVETEAPKQSEEGEKKVEAPKKEESKKEEPKSEEKPKKDEPKKDPEEWRKMIAKRRQDGAKSEEKVTDPKQPELSKPNEEKKPDAKAPDLTEEQKTLADKYGIEHEDYLKLFPPAKEIRIKEEGMSEEDRKTLEAFKTERDGLLIEKGFTDDFNTNILPLLKEEYPDISDEKIAEIKQQVLEKISTDEYASTPLAVVYRGDNAFRGLVPKETKGVDNGSRVPATSGEKVYDFENVTEDDIKKSDFPFEAYSAYMAKREKGK